MKKAFLTLVILTSIFTSLAIFAQDTTAFCRFVPEREDDFAFENNRIAFRVYGPAFKESNESNGIDCWLKRVDYPIINKWYKEASEGKTYHKDHGEGYDPYHVGSSLGCGSAGLWIDGKIIQPNVYTSYNILENGPDRVVFELTYFYEDQNIHELKTITLEKESQLCLVKSKFTKNDKPQKLKIAIGIFTHDGKATATESENRNSILCWEKYKDSYLGTAILLNDKAKVEYKDINSETKDRSHAVYLTKTGKNGVISYHTGFGWTKAGIINSFDDWVSYIESFKN